MQRVRVAFLLLLVSLLSVTSTRSRDRINLRHPKQNRAQNEPVKSSSDSSIIETLDEQDLEDIENFRRRQEEKQRLAAEEAYSEEVEELQELQRYGLLTPEFAEEEAGQDDEPNDQIISDEETAEQEVSDDDPNSTEQSESTKVAHGQQSSESSAKEMPEHRSTKRHKHRFKGFFGKVWKGIKKGAKFVGRAVGSALSWRIPDSVIVPPLFRFRKQDVEDCVACQYVWYLVELEVGNDQIYDNIFNAFTQTCLEAQKAAIFYPACQRMLSHITDITTDYMSGDYNINQLCLAAGFCRDPYPPPIRQM